MSEANAAAAKALAETMEPDERDEFVANLEQAGLNDEASAVRWS